MTRRRIAVVGGGVSGLTAAYLLNRHHDVVLYESESRLGGHAHTHNVLSSPQSTHPDTPGQSPGGVDSGFIVHNDRTYPQLLRLFGELGVETQPCEMSMSIRCDECGLQYAGGRGMGGILAQPRRLLDRRFWQVLLGVRRFHSRAARFLASSAENDTTTFGEWLTSEGFGEYLIGHYAVPLVSCVWSSGHDDAMAYPARYLFRFLDHHGMLSISGSPQWYTVTGGSARYVEKLAAHLPDVRTGEPVLEIRRRPKVSIRTAAGEEVFDAVVVATHADTALHLLSDPSDEERSALAAFGYTSNATVLHQDDSVLPPTPRAQASWNYRSSTCSASAELPTVTYWMNRLQGLPETPPFLVTLNATTDIPTERRLAEMAYSHPIFTPESVAAAEVLRRYAGDTVYAGAHLGWGFHEDGCRSGVEAAERLGVIW